MNKTATQEKIVSTLLRVKDETGAYVTTLPITTLEEVVVNVETGKTLATLITEMVDEIVQTKEYIIHDLVNVICDMAPFTDLTRDSSHIYINNLKSQDGLTITKGAFEEGRIYTDENELEFSLTKPLNTEFLPSKILVKTINKNVGNINYEVQDTNNALDAEPVWEDCSEAVKNGAYFTFTNMTKQADTSWAIGLRFKATKSQSTDKIDIYHLSIARL